MPGSLVGLAFQNVDRKLTKGTKDAKGEVAQPVVHRFRIPRVDWLSEKPEKEEQEDTKNMKDSNSNCMR